MTVQNVFEKISLMKTNENIRKWFTHIQLKPCVFTVCNQRLCYYATSNVCCTTVGQKRNAALCSRPYWVTWKWGTKTLVPDFHVIQFGLVRNRASSQWNSGNILNNTEVINILISVSKAGSEAWKIIYKNFFNESIIWPGGVYEKGGSLQS